MQYRLVHDIARQRAVEAVKAAPHGHVVRIDEPTRTLEQNAALHGMIGDVAKQLLWAGERLEPEDWKRLFAAAIWGQKVVPGLEGGFVVLNKRTSKMKVKEASDLIEFIAAWGSERGVKFGEGRVA